MTFGTGCIIDSNAFYRCNSLKEMIVYEDVEFTYNAFVTTSKSVTIIYYGISEPSNQFTINNFKQIALIVNVTNSYLGSTFCGMSVNDIS